MHALEERMGAADVSDDEQAAMLDRYAELSDRFRLGEGYTIDLQVATVLTGLGFSKEDYERPADTFSGGWQMRIALAKLLLGRPGLLLLDEPTNHLDLDARNWLESYLREYPHAVILVSHDRFFLDAVVTKIARSEPADDHRLPRQLQRLPGGARRAARAAARGQERAGRRGRTHQDVRRSLPLPGDQGRAGAEPDQAARQGRAHRGASGAQARALHVSGRAQERADGAGTHARPEGVRTAHRLRQPVAAHRARRSHCAGRPQRRRQVHADAHALGRRSARPRRAGAGPPGGARVLRPGRGDTTRSAR